MEGAILALGWVWFLAVIMGIVLLFYFFYKRWAITTAVTALVTIVCGVFLIYSLTHVVIPINNKGLVINTNTQTIDGEDRPSGVVSIPLMGAKVLTFPSVASYRPCEDETPAIAQSVAVTMTICYSSDASQINWKQQFLRQGEETAEKMFGKWHTLRSQTVSQAVGAVTTTDLTTDIVGVGKKIFEKAVLVFQAEGVPLNGVVVQFWDFANKEAGKIIDTKTADARADIEKAKLEREAALVRAQTSNDVMLKQTEGISKALDVLGIVDSQSRAKVFELRMLIDTLLVHPNVTLLIDAGGGGGGLANPVLAQPGTPATTQPGGKQ